MSPTRREMIAGLLGSVGAAAIPVVAEAESAPIEVTPCKIAMILFP